MAQRYGDRLLICFPQGFPSSTLGVGVMGIEKSPIIITVELVKQVRTLGKKFPVHGKIIQIENWKFFVWA
ncbi:MAG: hypothetical protein KKB21_04885 [Nanoarchaeota archaeon]|nr:hypothetical protein [Nanoarchaeota archaeon]MBU4086882.1 hypothetical protein [Nanoarchaeota archaeon]